MILPDENSNPFCLKEENWLFEHFGAFDVVCPEGVCRCNGSGELERKMGSKKADRLRVVLYGTLHPEVYKELFSMFRYKAFTVRNVLKLFRLSDSKARIVLVLKKT